MLTPASLTAAATRASEPGLFSTAITRSWAIRHQSLSGEHALSASLRWRPGRLLDTCASGAAPILVCAMVAQAVAAELRGVGLAEIEDAVGPDSFARARSYARGGRVLRVDWDEDKRALRARVLGQGRIYQTVAFFDDDGAGSLTFAEGECSCPVGHNCKHVAAVVLAARADRESPRSGPNGGAGGNGAGAILAQPFPGLSLEPASGTVSDACAGIGGPALTATEAAAWEQPLRALLDRPAAETQGKPLAFEFTLTARGRTAALTMRLMRPAARGGWVNGQLAWDGLDSWQVRDGGLRADHLAIARELNALHRAASGKPSYYYGYGRERQLDLSECDSRQLWPLLDEARRLGIALIHQHPPLGEVGLHGGEVVLDVRAAQLGGAQVQVALQLEDEHGPPSLRAVSFLGARGHGLVCVEPDEQDPECPLERLPLHLVRLARPVPSELRQMLLAGKPLQIPALQTGRFAAELCPSLQRIAPIVSSDGSFTPPEVSAPELALRASYGPGHALAVGWEWTYLVGDTLHRVALDAGDQAASFRDPEAERALLARAQIADTGLERFGLLDQRAPGGPAAGDAARCREHALQHRGAAGARAGRTVRGHRRGGAAALPRRRRDARGRHLHQRDRGRARLVRSRRDDRSRGARGAVRRCVRGARPRRDAHGARRWCAFLAARASAAGAPSADRGGQAAERLARLLTADQSLPGGAVGGARRARRGSRAGAGVATSGGRAAVDRRACRA